VKVAFVTPELLSLVRRTNLAGVAESLTQALVRAGVDVRVFLPRTTAISLEILKDVGEPVEVTVRDGRTPRTFEVRLGKLDELPVYLFENEVLFGTRHPYGDEEGPYADNWRRYALFSRAVLESLPALGFSPDVLHCVDWSTGLLPVYHEAEYVRERPEHPASKAGTFFSIHNLAMQGSFEREVLPHIGLSHELFRSVGGVELGGKVNYLKAGAEYSTVLGTLSSSHAERIQQKDRGYGLEETFMRRKKELVGITNGIDYAAWNPKADPYLTSGFGAKDKDPVGKRKCKTALQQAMGLDAGPRTPIACSIGRWDADSGFDLLAEILTPVLERGVELVIMGTGQPDVQQRLRTMEGTFMGRCRVVNGYDAQAAHMIMAGSDLLLLPSHYNPSNSLFAVGMRYGVAPLVYARSGLEDLVIDTNAAPDKGTGFHFEPYNSEGLMEGIEGAVKFYRNPSNWKALLRRLLAQDFSWESTAAEYLKAYRRVTRRVRARMKES